MQIVQFFLNLPPHPASFVCLFGQERRPHEIEWILKLPFVHLKQHWGVCQSGR